MGLHEKLRLAIELYIKLNGKERGALAGLSKAIGVSPQRINKVLKRNSQYGAAGFEQKIDAFLALNK